VPKSRLFRPVQSTQSSCWNQLAPRNRPGGGSGDSTLTFTSKKPTASLTVTQQPGEVGNRNGRFINGQQNGPQADLTPQTPNTPDARAVALVLDPAIKIRADTSINDPALNGKFLFLQLDQFNNQIVDRNGVLHTQQSTNISANKVLDVGMTGANPIPPGPLGYNTNAGTTAWPTEAVGVQESFSMFDQPFISTRSVFDQSITTNTWKFWTYLMYRPDGGVWIALDEVDWSWGLSGTNTGVNGNYNWNPPTLIVPAKADEMGPPVGGAAMPSWDDLSTNCLYNPPF